MAVLEKLRGWGIVLSILVALPLLLFIIDPSQIMQTVQSVSSKYDVGKIAGKSVSYTDFQQEVDRFTTISEIMSGSSASSEQQQKQIRDAAWQNLIDKYLFTKEAKAAGINVGKDEIMDLTNGETISPVLLQTPIFLDENGAFSSERLVEFLTAMEDDETGRLSMLWDYLQNSIVNAQFYNKYNALFRAAGDNNALQKSRNIEDNNTTANVEFVMAPHTYARDTTIVISDQEIKQYYQNHRNFFRQQATRDIEYAVFQVVPSAEDIAATNADFVRLYDEFAVTENVRAFLQRNSDRQWTDRWYKDGELKSVNADIDAFVSANAAGVSPVYSKDNNFFAARIMGQASLPDSVYVRHMLFQGADANHLADSLVNVLKKGGNFSSLAALYSVDKNSADENELGNLGWMTQTYMIPGFESVLTAKQHEPYVVHTTYGTHIVEVTKATRPVAKKQVAIFEKETLSSKETFNKYYNDANRLATLAAGSYKNYKAACDSIGIYSHPQTISEETANYGSIGHAKEVTRWAFDNKPGKASNIITVDNNYFFVVAVKDAHKEGYAEVSEVADQIRTQLYNQRYAAKQAEEVGAKIAGITDLQAIAEVLGTTVSTQEDIAFGSMAARSMDPSFVGAIAAAPVDKLTGPVAGNYGTYIFKVTGRNTGSYYTEEDAASYRNQVDSYFSQMLLNVMQSDFDVKDYRARFF